MEIFIILLIIANIILTFTLLVKRNNNINSKDISNLFTNMGSAIKDEFSRNRQENSSLKTESNMELSNNLKNISDIQKNQLDSFSKQLLSLTNSNEKSLNK